MKKMLLKRSLNELYYYIEFMVSGRTRNEQDQSTSLLKEVDESISTLNTIKNTIHYIFTFVFVLGAALRYVSFEQSLTKSFQIERHLWMFYAVFCFFDLLKHKKIKNTISFAAELALNESYIVTDSVLKKYSLERLYYKFYGNLGLDIGFIIIAICDVLTYFYT